MTELDFIVKEIHTVVMATIDENGLPVTCAIDIMDSSENSLYFLTAKGKSFFVRLKNAENKNQKIAFTGLKGNSTMNCVAVSVRGSVREIGKERLRALLEKNPYMNEIYPTKKSQEALTVFEIYNGIGEIFDLSKNPIERKSFVFGNVPVDSFIYEITNDCTTCKKCVSVCPQNCIDMIENRAKIKQENCLHCGNCFEVCPQKAVIKTR